MNYIGTKANTLAILNKFNTSPVKKFGQNFLIDVNILKKIVAGANITKKTLVIEVGPGIGALSEHLAQAAGHVICIEIDKMMMPILEENLKDFDNVTLINEDILKSDILAILQDYTDYDDIAVVANLPYYITTPIIMRFLEEKIPINRMVLMMQKEVASRLKAQPKTKEYNSLSIAISYYTTISKVTEVSKNAFHPRPAVDSTVIRLDRLEKPSVEVKDETFFFTLVRKAFVQRRKTLINNLLAGYGELSRFDFEQILNHLNIPLDIRADNLSISDYAVLSECIQEKVSV